MFNFCNVEKNKINEKKVMRIKKKCNFDPGELAEWSIAAVLKTVDCHRSGGSNPSLSAKN